MVSSSPASVTATLSAAVDPATVSAATVILVGRGPDLAFDTGDDVPVVPTSIGGSGSVITVDLSGVVLGNDVYRFQVRGIPTAPATHANLFAYWKLTEGSGSTASDSSPGGRHGTLNGAAWASGLFGKALSLNGGGQRVDIDAGVLTPGWTVAMWVSKTGAVDTIATSLMDSNSTTGISLRMEQFAAPKDVGITEYTAVDYGFGYVPTLQTWVHLAFTSDASNAHLFVNGVLEDTAPRAFNLHVDKLGTARTAATFSPICLMNEVQVYNRVLAQPEIASLAVLSGCVKGASGRALNGEFGGAFPSGDASEGGDFVTYFGVNVAPPTPPPAPPGAFTLISPANGATSVSRSPNFAWNAAAGAASYTLDVATDPGFASLAFTRAGLIATSSAPAVPLAHGTLYHWRVTAVNPNGTTVATGAPYSLTTIAAPTIDIVAGGDGCGLSGLELGGVLFLLLALRRRRRAA